MTYASPSPSLLRVSRQSGPHSCSGSSVDIFRVVFLTLWEGSRGRARGAVVIKSAVGDSHILGLPLSLPHSLTHPGHLAVLVSALYKCDSSNLLYCMFPVPFPCLDVFRYSNSYHCVTVGCSTQYRNKYRLAAQEQHAGPGSLSVQWAGPSGFVQVPL